MTADTAKSVEARRLISEMGGLVNAGDLTRRWSLSRARVSALVHDPTFPSAVGDVGDRPVWLAGECDRWRAMTTQDRRYNLAALQRAREA